MNHRHIAQRQFLRFEELLNVLWSYARDGPADPSSPRYSPGRGDACVARHNGIPRAMEAGMINSPGILAR